MKTVNVNPETVPPRTASPGQPSETPILMNERANGTEVRTSASTCGGLRTRGRVPLPTGVGNGEGASRHRTHEPERTQSVAGSNGQPSGSGIHKERRGPESASNGDAEISRELRQPKTCPTCGRRLPLLLLPGCVWCACGARVVAS